MTFDEMKQAIDTAKFTINEADRHVAKMVQIVAGRLRHCHVAGYYLEQLKRELRDFNVRTGVWRD